MKPFLEEWIGYYEQMAKSKDFVSFVKNSSLNLSSDFLSKQQQAFLDSLKTAISSQGSKGN